jgi:hypothetical protein
MIAVTWLSRLGPLSRSGSRPLPHRGHPAGLGHEEVRPLGRGHVHHAALHIAGQDQYLGPLFLLGQLIQHIHAVHPAGENHLHHYSVRSQLPHHAQQLWPVSGLPHDLEASLLRQAANQPLPELHTCVRRYDPFYALHSSLPF